MRRSIPWAEFVKVGKEWKVNDAEADVTQHGGSSSLVQAEDSL